MDTPWRIAFFIRHPDDHRGQVCPGGDFRAGCPPGVRATLDNVLAAVAAAPPTRFAGGGMWEAMHGAMRGYYEVRVRHRRLLYRLFCRLDHDPVTGQNLLAVIDGAVKPVGAAMPESVYARVRHHGDEYLARAPRSII